MEEVKLGWVQHFVKAKLVLKSTWIQGPHGEKRLLADVLLVKIQLVYIPKVSYNLISTRE